MVIGVGLHLLSGRSLPKWLKIRALSHLPIPAYLRFCIEDHFYHIAVGRLAL